MLISTPVGVPAAEPSGMNAFPGGGGFLSGSTRAGRKGVWEYRPQEASMSHTGDQWLRNSTSTSLELVEMNNEKVIHFWGTVSDTKYIPTIVTRNIAPCEFGEVYIYSMDLMFDRDVVTGSGIPNHYHVGARDTESLFNTSVNGKLSGITYTSFTPANGTMIPANTWYHCERVFTFPAAATTEG